MGRNSRLEIACFRPLRHEFADSELGEAKLNLLRLLMLSPAFSFAPSLQSASSDNTLQTAAVNP